MQSAFFVNGMVSSAGKTVDILVFNQVITTMGVKINGQLKYSSKYATMSVSEKKVYFSHAFLFICRS
ncbi:hypothetical protein J2736_004073 [Paenibacillus qinlingensis]|uniref:Uncharacterized protein n=1 Tax=Paenibacillus qinlingensis TaxID=1837343 RepID=A0ABU1NZE2_9BACL|nr:hypothetical protein [Paenibacillus qinlingensis]